MDYACIWFWFLILCRFNKLSFLIKSTVSSSVINHLKNLSMKLAGSEENHNCSFHSSSVQHGQGIGSRVETLDLREEYTLKGKAVHHLHTHSQLGIM